MLMVYCGAWSVNTEIRHFVALEYPLTTEYQPCHGLHVLMCSARVVVILLVVGDIPDDDLYVIGL
jgi:hypothetical protein